MGRRALWWLVTVVAVAAGLGLAGCGRAQQAAAPGGARAGGVMSAARACALVVTDAAPGLFTGPEGVHLVLTSYRRGEPVESGGDISFGMPPQTPVWVVEVHARAVHFNHSVPGGTKAAGGAGGRIGGSGRAEKPDTDYSVVLNARTGAVSDDGVCDCWPLPLAKAGTVVSLPPTC